MPRFLFLGLFLLTACTFVSEPIPVTRMPAATAVVISTVTPALTQSPFASATAVPTSAPTSQNAPQLEPTPTPILDTPAPEPPFCTSGRAFDSTALPASFHLGRVLFLNDDLWLWRQETGTADLISTGGNVTAYLNAPDNSAVAYIQNGNLWLWREGQAASQLTDNGSANNLRFSQDGSLIAYSRALGDDQYEIWAINSDGGPARLLATASAAETWERNPEAEKIDLTFHWATDSHILVYSFNPTLLGIGDPPPEPTFLVDADTGLALTALPIESREDVYSGYEVSFVTQPDGSAELSLVDVSNGRIALTVPTRYNAVREFSPDGRYLITSSVDSAIIIDLADLSQRPLDIPLRTVGVSHHLAALSSWWLDETTWYAVVPDSDDIFQPGATFTLWRINTSEGTATLFNTFSGFVLEVVLAPDKQHFAFWEDKQGGLRDLHLVNLATGEDVVYDNGRYSLIFDHWLSDSVHFVYSYQTVGNNQTCFLVGQIGQSPMPFPNEINPHTSSVIWVDETTFILNQDALSEGFSLGTLYWHSLHGERMHIGDYVRPTTGEPPDASFVAYFVEP